MNAFESLLNRRLNPASTWSRASPAARGVFFACVTIVIWVSFIIIARASSKGDLSGLDIAALRILGASFVLLPLGYWINYKRTLANSAGPLRAATSFWGLSPLSRALTVQMGLAGGLLYAVFSYSGFFFAPAAHASVLLPGSLPLWTSLIAWLILSQPLSRQRVMGLLLILIGDLMVGGPSLLSMFKSESVWRGDMLFILAMSK